MKIKCEVLKPFQGYNTGDQVLLKEGIYRRLRRDKFVSDGTRLAPDVVPEVVKVDIVELYKGRKRPSMTVALPTYNNSNAIWLQLESLCRQEEAPAWELIVCEEASDKYFGAEGLKEYVDRLKKGGCVRVVFLDLKQWIPLSKKWLVIAEHMADSSYAFVLAASDNYSENCRLEQTYDTIFKGAEWVHWGRGAFYNVLTGKAAMYDHDGKTGLFMAMSKRAIEKVARKVSDYPAKGVDTWLRKALGNVNAVNLGETAGVHTDGVNTISINRRHLYQNSSLFTPIDGSSVFRNFPAEIQKRIKSIQDGKKERSSQV